MKHVCWYFCRPQGPVRVVVSSRVSKMFAIAVSLRCSLGFTQSHVPMATPIPFVCNVTMDLLCNILVRRLAVGYATEAEIHPQCGADCKKTVKYGTNLGTTI